MVAPITPSNDESFVWPEAAEIRRIQRIHLTSVLLKDTSASEAIQNLAGTSLCEDGLYKDAENRVWLPADASDLQLRICIVAHTGIGGHRGYSTTLSTIRQFFTWETMDSDVKTFCNTCLHCQSTVAGDRTPRPFGQALHASKPNEVLHMDYLYMGPSSVGYKYLLLLKDDLSSYLWLVPAKSADAKTTVDALVEWFAAFGVVSIWVSDRGSHFKNRVIDGVRKALRTQHHFTTAYSPWANGTVERACREVLRAVRALLSEFKLGPRDWPAVAPIVQAALNSAPSPQRGDISPLTAFTGRPTASPLLSIVEPRTFAVLELSEVKLQQRLAVDELRSSVERIHKAAHESAERRRAAVAARRKSKSGMETANLDIGDYVLVAKRDFHSGDKLTLRWRGPHRVVGTISDHVYDVEDLLTGKITPVHASRLRFYSDAALEVSAELLDHIAHNNSGFDIQALRNLRYDPETKSYCVEVSWLGFDEAENTWEPLANLAEDVPELVERLLENLLDKDLAAAARNSCLP
jgi:hypothetical protein